MKITLHAQFQCEAERLFAEVLKSRTLHYVAKPLIYFKPEDALPEIWQDGQYPVKMYLFNLVYLGKQWINIRVHASDQALLDAGRGQLVRQWHHWIRIRPSGPQTAHYTDTVDIEAGWLTLPVAAFAWFFYRHRQNRWRQLIANHFREIT